MRSTPRFFSLLAALFLLAGALTACEAQPTEEDTTTAPAACEDGGLELPDGFCATVVAEGVGPARHLAVLPNGDLYVKLRNTDGGGGIVALRDTSGDGRADVTERFGDFGGTGIALRNGYLYASSQTAVMRYPLAEDALAPSGSPETVVDGFPEQRQHAAKSFTFGDDGSLFVNVGAPSNACQEQSRTPGSAGLEPCPQLERHGGIWRFDADETGQTQTEDARFASGIRNAVALEWNPVARTLYAVQHGRDQLSQLWPDLYTEEESAELPSEEFVQVSEGDDFGWPYCYNDHQQDAKVLAPEYGGDGQEIGRCAEFEKPAVAFPGHWGPNDLLFYTGESFPESYQGGAFIAFHGSWNRAPLPQAGYKIVFVPLDGSGQPAGEYRTFADGFAGERPIEAPGDAQYRPTGLAQGTDGALYIADSREGRIWRVTYAGSGGASSSASGR